MSSQDDRTHGEVWDGYVQGWRNGTDTPGLARPGDHWGTPHTWGLFFKSLITKNVHKGKKFIEIGQGSGKYTEMILNTYPGSEVVCYDVSGKFLEETASNLKKFVSDGRLHTVLLDNNYKTMITDIDKRGWRGHIDCVCSFDAMVHVDMQYLAVYLLTAMETLKPGGVLAMTLADITTDRGFNHLISDLKHVYPFEGRACMQFRWQSKEMIVSVLNRLGFIVKFMKPSIGGDMEMVATLKSKKPIKW